MRIVPHRQSLLRFRFILPLAVLAFAVGVTAAGKPVGAAFPGANGKIAFVSDRDGNQEIYVMNPDGSGQERLTTNAARDLWPAWSPDGSKIAFNSDRDGNGEIYVMFADGSTQTNLTNNPAGEEQPTWSPDGSKIAFRTDRDGNSEIYVMNADGSGQTKLTNNPADDAVPSWSPDGTKIAFVSLGRDGDGNSEIYVMNADGSGQTRLTNDDIQAEDGVPDWSPEGSMIAFQSSRDGNFEVYVMNADGSGQTNVTNNGASDGDPSWSPDGTKIVFFSDRDDVKNSGEIYVMNADGSGQTRITSNATSDGLSNWQPMPVSPSVVITIQNTGPSFFTMVVLGFDLPPINEGQNLEAWVGDHGSPSNIGDFLYGGLPISEANPLPPGGTASTPPLSELIAGTTCEGDWVSEFGNGFGVVICSGYPEVVPDFPTLPFDWPHASVTGGRLSGVVRFYPYSDMWTPTPTPTITLTPTITPTPTPAAAECDIAAQGIAANPPALNLRAGDPPAVVDVSLTWKNLGAATQGVPAATCTFGSAIGADILVSDPPLVTVAVDPTKLGVRVAPAPAVVISQDPPFMLPGDVCLACTSTQGTKSIGDCLDPTKGAKGPFDPAPIPPPYEWTYQPVRCDEASWNSSFPFSVSSIADGGCRDGVDNNNPPDGLYDWAGYSSAPDTVNCRDIPAVGLIPVARQVLAPDATTLRSRQVEVECRDVGVFPLLLWGGNSQATDKYTSGSNLGAIDPNGANNSSLTVITVTCAENPDGTPTPRPTPTPTVTPTPTPAAAECDIAAQGIVANPPALSLEVGERPAVVDLSSTWKNLGAVTQGVPPATCNFWSTIGAEISVSNPPLVTVAVDPTKLGVRVAPAPAVVISQDPRQLLPGDVCLSCTSTQGTKSIGDCLDPTKGAQGPFDPPCYPVPQPSCNPAAWTYQPVRCDEASWNPGIPLSLTLIPDGGCRDGVDNNDPADGLYDWASYSPAPDPNCVSVQAVMLIPVLRTILAPGATAVKTRQVEVECRDVGIYPLFVFAGDSRASDSEAFCPNCPQHLGATDPNGANNSSGTVITVDCTGPGVDSDNDGLSDTRETGVYHTDPYDADTDDDGLNDGDEVSRHTDPLDPDTDNDGLNDGDEVSRGTNPLNADTDGDGLDDNDEVSLGTNPVDPDTDDDGLNDGDEVTLGSDPFDTDTDDDTVLDGSDNCLLLANADQANTDGDSLGDLCDPDDDNDGLSDGDETSVYGTLPLNPDSDGDGLNDGFEVSIGTDPLLADTDGDGFSDRVERNLGSDPLDNASRPEHNDNAGSCWDTLDNDLDGDVDGADAGCVGGPPPPDVEIDTGVFWTTPDGTTAGIRGWPTTVTKTVAAVSVEITIAQVDGVPPVLAGLMTDTSGGDGTAWEFNYTPSYQWPPQSMTSIKMCLDTDGDGLHDDGCQVAGVFLVDPSGVVSDDDIGMPISGATVTLERLNPAQSAYQAMAMPLDGGMFSPEVNPQLTGEDGRYAWDVVPGEYRVQVQKAGCDDATSRSVTVPPPATDLDVGLTCPDTDADGLKDYQEIELGTSPSNPDTDYDGFEDYHEVQLGTDPTDPDTDEDSALDGSDNCPLLSNPGQENGDGGRRANGPQILGEWASNPAQDKAGDACDPDDDNDGLPDVLEFDDRCPYRLVADSDGDGVSDGYEVANGFDPCNAASKPTWVGGSDSDGDGLLDGTERGGYNTCAFDGDTTPGWATCIVAQDSDGDGCADMVEVLDLDGNRRADIGDFLLLTMRKIYPADGSTPPDPVSDSIFDIDKNTRIDVGDQLLQAVNSCNVNGSQLGCPVCPPE